MRYTNLVVDIPQVARFATILRAIKAEDLGFAGHVLLLHATAKESSEVTTVDALRSPRMERATAAAAGWKCEELWAQC